MPQQKYFPQTMTRISKLQGKKSLLNMTTKTKPRKKKLTK